MKAQCLPFSQIPHTSRLFADFLAYRPSVQPFYPHSPHFSEWMKAEALRLDYDPARRERVTAILERQNKTWEASPQTLANIDRLRRGACAVVTGQQVGLFGGPTFAIYKALTAVKLAEEARAAGVDAVPVFWLATSDHDLAEVNHVSLPGADGLLHTVSTSSHDVAGAPVSQVRLGEEIVPAREEAISLLGDSPAVDLLRNSYRPGETMGTAFARLYARLFADWGVILLDASDADLHRVASPLYRAAIERGEDLVNALLARNAELERAGYEQQVKVTENSVLLFALKDGARTPIHRRPAAVNGEPEFVIAGQSGSELLSGKELLQEIESAPERFSPNVLLRPVTEDYLLPTLVYTGGAAETAYFAQVGAVYETLLGRVTPIVPRFSATIVEPKVQRWLRQYEITVRDAFQGADALKQILAARVLPAGLQGAFERAEREMQAAFADVLNGLEKLDATLVDAGKTAASKAQYQLERLRERASAAAARRNEIVMRHAENLSQALYPAKGLQERGVGGIYFVARYGFDFLRDLHDNLRTACHDHQILEM